MVSLKETIANNLLKIAVVMGANKKSFENLWSMVSEGRMFQGSLSDPYRQNSNVYKAVRTMADNVSQVDFKIVRKGSEENLENHPLLELLQSPNPLMSFNQLMEVSVIHYALYGELFYVFEKSMGQLAGISRLPAEIWPFHPKKFKAVISKGVLRGWDYNGQRYEVEDVLHSFYYDTANDHRGLSPLDPSKDLIDVDWKSMIFQKSFYDNDATPGFVLATDKSLQPEQAKRIAEDWTQRYSGPSKSFKMAVLEAGLKPVTIGTDQRKMQFIEQKRFQREEILGIWKVPKSLFGITDDLNYATFIGQKKMFWTEVLMPIFAKIEDDINKQIAMRFSNDARFKFDFTNVIALQEDFDEKVDTAKKLFEIGFTRNEINKRLQLGFEDVAWGDVAWFPMALTPVKDGEPSDPAAQEPKDYSPKISKNFQKLFQLKQAMIEVKMEKKLSAYFFGLRKRVLDNLNSKNFSSESSVKYLTLSWRQEEEEFSKVIRPLINEGIIQGVAQGRSFIEQDVNEQLLQVKLSSFLEYRTGKSRAIIQRFGKRIVSVVNDGLSDGESINEISKRVRDEFNVIGNKAKTIARTEATGAVNGGSNEYYKEAGVEKKMWLTSRDAAVRHNHQFLDGQIVPVDKAFSNGLQYPGGDGAPEEVINCRCTTIPVLNKE